MTPVLTASAVLGVAVLVAWHARRSGLGPWGGTRDARLGYWGWFAGSLLVPMVFVPAYLCVSVLRHVRGDGSAGGPG